VLLGGCQSTIEPASQANLTPRDRALLAHARYARASLPDKYQRQIVSYSRTEAPGTIVVDTDARVLYFVLSGGKAIRYGVTGRRTSAGVFRRGEGREKGRMAALDPDPGDPGAARPLPGAGPAPAGSNSARSKSDAPEAGEIRVSNDAELVRREAPNAATLSSLRPAPIRATSTSRTCEPHLAFLQGGRGRQSSPSSSSKSKASSTT
jgi:hypothetical protein